MLTRSLTGHCVPFSLRAEKPCMHTHTCALTLGSNTCPCELVCRSVYLRVCAYVAHVGDMTRPRLWLRGWGSERPAPSPTVSHGVYTAGLDAQLCGYVLCDPQLVMHTL